MRQREIRSLLFPDSAAKLRNRKVVYFVFYIIARTP